MCRLRKCDYRTDRHTHTQTDGRTDTGQSDPYVPLCFAGDTKTRAPMGHWSFTWVQWAFLYLYKLDSRVKNLTTEWNQKQQNFVTHASRSLRWIRFVAVAFRSEAEVRWRRGPPITYLFYHPLHPSLGIYGQNILMHVPGHEHFIPTKFRKHPLSGSVVKADYVFPYIYMH